MLLCEDVLLLATDDAERPATHLGDHADRAWATTASASLIRRTADSSGSGAVAARCSAPTASPSSAC